MKIEDVKKRIRYIDRESDIEDIENIEIIETIETIKEMKRDIEMMINIHRYLTLR